MSDMPAAGQPITVEFAARLVGANFPDLVRHPVHTLTEGWEQRRLRIGTE
jgi:hypothetical protein